MPFIPNGSLKLNLALVYAVALILKRQTDNAYSVFYNHEGSLEENRFRPIDRMAYLNQHPESELDNRENGWAPDLKQGITYELKVDSVDIIDDPYATKGSKIVEVHLACTAPETHVGAKCVQEVMPPYTECLSLPDSHRDATPFGNGFSYPVDVQEVADGIRQSLATGDLKSFIISEPFGTIVPVPQDIWRTEFAAHIFIHGVPAVFINDGHAVSGNVFVSQTDVEALCEYEHNLTIEHVRKEYVSPYMEYMDDIARKYNLSGSKKVLKKQLEHWIESDWPAVKLGKWSKTKGEYMATFLRHPDDESRTSQETIRDAGSGDGRPSRRGFNR